MKEWLILAFIFFIGSLAGWLLELIFRRFFSKANPSRKWINPGFLVGPYLPLYGFSLCVVYLLAHINVSFIHGVYLRKTVLFLLMALSVTLIEYFAGLIFIKGMHVKLWDYSDEKFNIQGIICPKFTFFWYLLSAIYYFLIHPNIIEKTKRSFSLNSFLNSPICFLNASYWTIISFSFANFWILFKMFKEYPTSIKKTP